MNEADIKSKATEAALALAADTPWQDITLSRIADEADLSLGELYGVTTREVIEAEVDVLFDRAMLEESVSQEDPPRERLFDALMLRFEAMEPYRRGIVSMMRHRTGSPASRAQAHLRRLKTARWALIAAGLDAGSVAPPRLKELAIAHIIADVEAAWRRETSSDFAHTMAALDKGLRKMEDRLVWLQKISGQTAHAKSSEKEPKEEILGGIQDEPAGIGD